MQLFRGEQLHREAMINDTHVVIECPIKFLAGQSAIDFLERQAWEVRRLALDTFLHHMESMDYTHLLIKHVREASTRLRPRAFGLDKGGSKGCGKGRSEK